jgi:hypothetical protein
MCEGTSEKDNSRTPPRLRSSAFRRRSTESAVDSRDVDGSLRENEHRMPLPGDRSRIATGFSGREFGRIDGEDGVLVSMETTSALDLRPPTAVTTAAAGPAYMHRHGRRLSTRLSSARGDGGDEPVQPEIPNDWAAQTPFGGRSLGDCQRRPKRDADSRLLLLTSRRLRRRRDHARSGRWLSDKPIRKPVRQSVAGQQVPEGTEAALRWDHARQPARNQFASSHRCPRNLISPIYPTATTSNRSAAWADPVHPVPRHDLYACELPIGGSFSTAAVAMRQRR